MADIFISYAREDRPWAERFARALNDEGFRVWCDIDSLRLGASFASEIEQAVSRAKAVVVLWSRHSQSSEWGAAEASLAWKQGKLCSVIVETGTDVPFPFNTRHALSLASWDGSTDTPAFQRLRADLAAGAPTEERKPDPPAAPAAGSTSAERTPGGKREAASPEPEMVRIKPGEFLMGCPAGENGSADERPQHEVRIAQPFWIGKYAVTFDEYDAFAEATGRALPGDHGWGRGRRPVINVAWGDAVDYAHWLAERTGKRYRLPSEAEWEYAARAGTTTPYSTGHWIDRTQANFAKNILQELFGKTLIVGSFPANPWGLHDMHGNVGDWVQDCWRANYERAPTDGSAWLEANGGDCGRRVVRGGAWYYLPEFLRSAYRYGGAADSRSDILGFRLAQDR